MKFEVALVSLGNSEQISNIVVISLNDFQKINAGVEDIVKFNSTSN